MHNISDEKRQQGSLRFAYKSIKDQVNKKVQYKDIGELYSRAF